MLYIYSVIIVLYAMFMLSIAHILLHALRKMLHVTHIMLYVILMGQDSSVGVPTHYRLDGPEVETR